MSNLIAFSADAVVAVLLYVLLGPVSRTLALVAAALRLVAHPAIASIDILNQFMTLQLLTSPEYSITFSPEQLNSLALLLLTAHGYGYLIGGVFFGLHLLGYLLYQSELFPAILGGLIVLAAVGYLTETFTFFLVPAYEPIASTVVLVTAVIGEVVLALDLVVREVRTQPSATSEVA